jgi:hypothetical protein
LRAPEDMRVLLLGGDAAAPVAVSSALGIRPSCVISPRDIDPSALSDLGFGCEVVILVAKGSTAKTMERIHMVAAAGLQDRALMLGDGEDHLVLEAAIDAGFRGFIGRGVEPARLARAVVQVAERGAVYDSPAASILASKRGSVHSMGFMGAARSLAAALEMKDTYTGGHAERVTSLALRLTRAARGPEMAEDPALEAAFLLHDVGKIGIPDTIRRASPIPRDGSFRHIPSWERGSSPLSGSRTRSVRSFAITTSVGTGSAIQTVSQGKTSPGAPASSPSPT